MKWIKIFYFELPSFVETQLLGYAYSRSTYSYYDTKPDHASFKIQLGRVRTFAKQLLVYDANDMIGSIGGSLGLFLGFSFFGIISTFIDKLLELGTTIQQKRNQIMLV